jgi:hypothetical protein
VKWVPDNPKAEALRRQFADEFFGFFHPKLQRLLLNGYKDDLPSSAGACFWDGPVFVLAAASPPGSSPSSNLMPCIARFGRFCRV